MKIFKSVSDLIGRTPIIELCKIKHSYNLNSNLYAKVEFFNPSGSIKDRASKFMLDEAEKQNLITKDTVIIEPTSGNTGIGLASICASRGYRVILTMSENMSMERQMLLKAYGAKIILTDASKGMKGAIDKALELLKTTPNAFMPSQFTNIANVTAHKETTGPEIWSDMEGKIDILVAGIGTGGTITGTGEYLRSVNPKIEIYGVEPKNSPFFSEGISGAHGLQGIGAGFCPEIFNKDICTDFIPILEDDAYACAREIAKQEGILVGISSGAALCAAIQLAKKEENAAKNIVVILADTGERYLSTPLFTDKTNGGNQ